MKRIVIVTTIVFFGITGCSRGGPTESEVRNTLAKYTDKKGCASSLLFKELPVKESLVESNKHILNPLVNVGLIEKAGNAYVPTSLGMSVYDVDASGFCYTDQYVITDITVMKEESKGDLSPALSGAWYVSFKISPNNVREWVKDPRLIKAASLASIENITGTKSFTVRLAKKVGDSKLIVADPGFSFSPGIHFNLGW